MKQWLNELRRLSALSIPVVLSQLGVMLLFVVDSMMVGHYDVDALAAAYLGGTCIGSTRMFGMGVVFGIEPLVSQAHGARDARKAGDALQQGLIVALIVSVPTIALWCFTEEFLLLAGQSSELARAAESYVLIQAPAVPVFYAVMALRGYLQCRGIMYPITTIIFTANVLNVFLNWVLIFGNLGAPQLGLNGAALATCCVEVFTLIVLAVWIVRGELYKGGWAGWRRDAIAPKRLANVFRLGVPIGLQIGLEGWAFQISTLGAGLLGTTELASHSIVLNLASLSFMVPLGMSIATATRVGNHIGAEKLIDAQRAAWTALSLGGAVMICSASVFIIGREVLPLFYTTDTAVVSLAASIFPIAAAFQLFDGVQVVGSGILRGMGRTRPAAAFNLLGYYVLALPLGWMIATKLGAGLAGIWWGLCIGLGVVATMLVLWIGYRGPTRAFGRAS